MRSVIWSAFLAAAPFFCGMSAPRQETPQASQPQQQTGVNPSATPADPAKLAAPAAPAASVTGIDDKVYVLGADDQIQLRVWGDDRLSMPLLIRPDGRISVNLVGEVVAAGKTPEQLAKEIERLLKEKEILTRPSVTVYVTAVQSKKYMINGEVNKPGAFPLTVPTTILEALVNSGGFKDFANKKDIQIIRGDQRFRFNWNDVIKGKHKEQNRLLEPGDIIIVK